ncbi:MAG: 9-O-acetylesterase, partial [Limisphaerales bacterium]
MQRLVYALVFLFAVEVTAAVRLPGFFGDHMVLQREIPIPIWGWAAPGEEVTVELGANSVTGRAGLDGKWRVKMPAMKAGGPHV